MAPKFFLINFNEAFLSLNSHQLKFFKIVLLFFFSSLTQVFSQEIRGVVIDASSALPVEM
jgi:hypothetical protein